MIDLFGNSLRHIHTVWLLDPMLLTNLLCAHRSFLNFDRIATSLRISEFPFPILVETLVFITPISETGKLENFRYKDSRTRKTNWGPCMKRIITQWWYMQIRRWDGPFYCVYIEGVLSHTNTGRSNICNRFIQHSLVNLRQHNTTKIHQFLKDTGETLKHGDHVKPRTIISRINIHNREAQWPNTAPAANG